MAKVATPRQTRIILGVFGCVTAFGAWGLSRAPTDDGDAQETCLEPYFAALDRGATREAYAGYTTEDFRAAHPVASYEAELAARIAAQGRLVRREPRGANGFSEVSGGRGFHVRYTYRFEHGDPHDVQFRLVEEAGRWRIASMGERRPGVRALAEGAW